jgi:hypothetical protein
MSEVNGNCPPWCKHLKNTKQPEELGNWACNRIGEAVLISDNNGCPIPRTDGLCDAQSRSFREIIDERNNTEAKGAQR